MRSCHHIHFASHILAQKPTQIDKSQLVVLGQTLGTARCAGLDLSRAWGTGHITSEWQETVWNAKMNFGMFHLFFLVEKYTFWNVPMHVIRTFSFLYLFVRFTAILSIHSSWHRLSARTLENCPPPLPTASQWSRRMSDCTQKDPQEEYV